MGQATPYTSRRPPNTIHNRNDNTCVAYSAIPGILERVKRVLLCLAIRSDHC